MWKSREDGIKRAEIFDDTMEYIEKSDILSAAVARSIAGNEFYGPDQYPGITRKMDREGSLAISGERSFQAATRLVTENPGKKVAVLNMASAVIPGGGVAKKPYASGAQEESLCLASTLYPVLNVSKFMAFYYMPNKRAHNNLHSDAVLYSPGIVVCKTDEAFPRRIPAEQFSQVDVVSAAAPNLNVKNASRYSGDSPYQGGLSDEALYELIYQRFKHVLHICAANQVDMLVASAWGCGAFKCPEAIVSKAMIAASREYLGYFDQILYAIKRSPKRTNANYEAFAAAIGSIEP